MRVLLLRHGESTFNVARARAAAQADSPTSVASGSAAKDDGAAEEASGVDVDVDVDDVSAQPHDSPLHRDARLTPAGEAQVAALKSIQWLPHQGSAAAAAGAGDAAAAAELLPDNTFPWPEVVLVSPLSRALRTFLGAGVGLDHASPAAPYVVDPVPLSDASRLALAEAWTGAAGTPPASTPRRSSRVWVAPHLREQWAFWCDEGREGSALAADPWLHVDGGDRLAPALARLPEKWYDWPTRADAADVSGESTDQVVARARLTAEQLRQLAATPSAPACVLLVGHADFFFHLTARKIAGEWFGQWLDNCEIYATTVDALVAPKQEGDDDDDAARG